MGWDYSEVYRWENDITFIDRYLITRIRLPIYYPINVATSFLVNSTGTLPLKFLPMSDLHLLVYAIQSRRIVANFDSLEALVLALVLGSCFSSGSSSGYEVRASIEHNEIVGGTLFSSSSNFQSKL